MQERDVVALTEAALHAQADAVAVAASNGALLFLNTAGQRLLKVADGLYLSHGRLCAQRPSEAQALSAAIEQACSAHRGAVVRISTSGDRALRVVVSPCPVRGRTSALLMINDPVASDLGLAEHLISLYGLTGAEAAAIACLAAGRTPAQVAEARGVSLSTVRSQIQQALQKSDCGRLTELLRQIALLPRVAANPSSCGPSSLLGMRPPSKSEHRSTMSSTMVAELLDGKQAMRRR